MPNDEPINQPVGEDTPGGVAPQDMPAGLPVTPATNAVWAALAAHDGATSAELAAAADVGRSTANKTLAALEAAGVAVRESGGRDGGKRLPDRWRTVRTVTDEHAELPSPAAAESDAVEASTPDADEEAPSRSTAVNGRLGSGKLREMVVAHLRQHARQEFSPSALGKALRRSSGAIANICGSSDPSIGLAIAETDLVETLTALESEGLVTRVRPAKKGGTAAWRWTPTTTEDARAGTAPDRAADTAEPHQRLRPGELHGRVLAFMQAHPGEELSPTAVARALAASSGAVNNALERLVGTGEVVRTQESPRRFASAPTRKE